MSLWLFNGPPAYFTPDWPQARASVEKLAAPEPRIAATGHGVPMHGAELRRQLYELAAHSDQKAVPAHGCYVGHPAVADETGMVSVRPRKARCRRGLSGRRWWAAAGTCCCATKRNRPTAATTSSRSATPAATTAPTGF